MKKGKEGVEMNNVTYTLLLVSILSVLGLILFILGFGDHFFLSLSGIAILTIALLTIKRAQKRNRIR